MLLLATASGIGCWPVAHEGQPTGTNTLKDAVDYSVLEDGMGTKITIGIKQSATEQQLRATLVKAANDHQDDSARDYLTSMFLSVEAYLVSDDDRTTIPAGTLKRYVPPGNPSERRKLTIDRTKDDVVTIRLSEARQTLR
jgi:hypothetical protein